MKRTAITISVLLALSACGDPLQGIDRVSEGAVLPQEPGNAVRPTDEELAREGSILGGLFSRSDPAPATSDDLAPTDTAETVAPEATDLTSTEVAIEAPAADARGTGVLGWLRRSAAANTPAASDVVVASVDQDAPLADETVARAEPVEVEAPTALAKPQARRGLFGAARPARRNGPDATDVPYGAVVPFGQIARVCEARGQTLGKLVDEAARKGTGYKLFDSAIGATGPRTFYITGFSDNCPRQFTAALALFGAPAFHEQLRYGLPADQYPYSTTDQAYEKVKSRVCNVGRNTPCGARISRLERNTTFVSAYENFKDNARWADMLLHDGEVLAKVIKTP